MVYMPPDVQSKVTRPVPRTTREQEDNAARFRGYRDADHFLELAARSFGPWVWREYQAIFLRRWKPQPPGGV